MNPKDKHADWLLKPTANELADEVEMWGKDLLALNMKGGIPVIEGAKLLRQQQAEIEALKQIIDANNLNQNIGQFVKPTNEPVAWMNKIATSWVTTTPDEFKDEWIPLYTHPVKPSICVGHWDNKTGAFHKHLTKSQQRRVDEGFLKPVYTAGMLPIKELALTDEEIEEIGKQYLSAHAQFIGAGECHYEGEIEFARAILRKAQGK